MDQESLGVCVLEGTGSGMGMRRSGGWGDGMVGGGDYGQRDWR